MSLKQALKKIIHKSALHIPTSMLLNITKTKGISSLYHTVSNEDLPHINQLYRVKKTSEFKADLDFLLKHYTPVDYKTYIDIKVKGTKLNKPVFLLTFDDGLKEFNEVISPILLNKGIPAICFLNSDFIDNKNLFFRYKISLLINECLKNRARKNRVGELLNNSKNITQSLLNLSYNNTLLINHIAEEIDFSFNDFLQKKQPYLNTPDINNLINKGFQFGAHSIDHPEFRFISLEEQIIQTKTSMDIIQKKFNLNYKAFAFPFTDHGVDKDFFNYINNHKITDNTFGCAGYKTDVISNNYQRIAFEKGTLSGKEIHNAELLSYLLKKPLNKHIVKRNG